MRHVVRFRQRGDRLLQLLFAGLEGRRRRIRLLQHRGLRAGQLEAEPIGSRSTTASGSCTSTPQYDKRRQASNFFMDQWSRRPGAGAVRRRLRQRRVSLHGHQPAGDEPADRTSSSVRTPRWRSAPIVPNSGNLTNGLVQAGQGIPDHDLHLAGARRRAAVRDGLRPDRRAAVRAARRRRPVLRSPVRQRGLRAGAQPADTPIGHAPLRAAADASAQAGSRPRRRRR